MNFGRYQIIKEIGKGGMGMVYQAHDPNLDLLVALKVLHRDIVGTASFVERFHSEARVLGRLDRANIVRIYNIDEEDNGTVYIAMEYVEGESLAEVMKRKQFSPDEIINLGITIAKTLNYAHQKGVIHRDIKPSNIMIRSDGFLKITDFGIAHIQDSRATIKTQAGEILGTPAYMSPEQVISKPIDGRSDIFSLGIILYELCTGIRPFRGDNMAAIFQNIMHEDPVEIENINPSIPNDLSKIVMKCLRKKPDERFENGQNLVAALDDCLKKKTTITMMGAREKNNKIVFILLGILSIIIIGGSSYYIFVIVKTKPPPIELAIFNIESTPVGALVFIDSKFKGNTPLKLKLPIGKHEVSLTLPDYYDWEAQIKLTEDIMDPVYVKLIPINEKSN